jgi:thiosulfate reductase cytochrome b subunit
MSTYGPTNVAKMGKDQQMNTAKQTIQPAWVRITHWLNALAIVIMVFSGWQIYNASPIFHFVFPKSVTLGGWLAGGIMWHFAAMWLLVANGLLYLAINLVSGRAWKKFLPISPKAMARELYDAIRLRLGHQDLSQYNMLQRAAYLFVWIDALVLVCSGLVLWKSVQFPLLRDLFGGYNTARVVHFVAMALMVGFVIVHVVMVALVPRSFMLMIRGR